MRPTQRIILFTGIPIIVTGLAIVSEYSGFDLWLESLFFDTTTGTFPYRSLFFTSTVLHTGGRSVVVLFALLNVMAIILSFFNTRLATYRKHLVFILLAAAIGPSLISYLKGATHIYIPWELIHFGGDKPYIRLFDPVPEGAEIGLGFPGGHSSAGFAYLSAFFALTAMGSRYRFYGALIPILLGMLFSATQLVRGAHFISHDMISFAICWTAPFLLSLVFYPAYYRGYKPAH